MQDKKQRLKNSVKYTAFYSVGFLAAALVLIVLFEQADASFARLTDGVAQHFAVLTYLRKYLLKLLEGGFSFPMVDFSIGQGFDVIGTLNYYGFGDPVNLLTVLFPERYLEEMYAFLILFRMYLSGLAFSFYFHEAADFEGASACTFDGSGILGTKRMAPVLCGAWLYAFCGFALLGGMKHPLFLNGMLYLPLLLAGLERFLQKRGVRFLVAAVGFSFMSNYYFMYMNTVLCGVYLLVRFSGHYREYGIKRLLALLGKIAGIWIWGACLGAVILLPSVYAFLHNARGGENTGAGVVYSAWYYVKLFESFLLTLPATNHWSVPGTAGAGLAGVLMVLCSDKKEDRRLKLGFGVLFLMLCCPFVGKMMNGFSYVTNRWSYGMAFMISLMTVRAVCSLYEGAENRKFYMLALAAGALETVLLWRDKKTVLIGVAMFAVTVLVFGFCKRLSKRKNYRAVGILLSFAVVGSVCWNLISFFSPAVYQSTKSFAAKGQPQAQLADESVQLLTGQALEKEKTGRVELTASLYNRALTSGLHGTAFYYSVVPREMKELYESLGMAEYTRSYVFKGLEGRKTLLDLASVQYETCEDAGGEVYLKENTDALPLGYTYDRVMSRETYEKLTPLERQAALLEYAVVEAENTDGFEEGQKTAEGILTEQAPKIRRAKKATFQKGKLKGKKGGMLELIFETEKDMESYLVLHGFFCTENKRREHALYVEQEGRKKEIGISGKKTGSSVERDFIAVNLGRLSAGRNICSICFSRKLVCGLKKLKIQNLSVSGLDALREERAREALTDIEIKTNEIKGKISVSDKKILQLAVPYSSGWTAYVDGKKTELFTSGVAYMGMKLEKGVHEIELRYRSPWILEGAVLCILAAAGLFVPYKALRKRKKGIKFDG